MDFLHPLNCLTFNVQRAARSLGRGFEQAVKSAGLTAPQFTTLALLSGYGEMTVGQFAERLGTERTTMTRNLEVLVAKGWIAPLPSGDLRLRPFGLTDAGRERLATAMPAWTDYQTRLVDAIGSGPSETLLHVMAKL
jgi:DNA-binding MarR family transcriptional regulator